MSSGSKSSPRGRGGRRKKNARGTSRRTSASPRSSRERPAALELIFRLAKVLSRKKLRWYVFGAQAVNVHGVPRMSADVDVTVDVPSAERASLLGALKRASFVARVEDIESFAKRTRVLPFFHEPTGMPLDLVIAGEGLEVSFLERAQMVDLGGFRVPVISIEDLVVAKIVAGRPKDLEDVQNLIAIHPEGDLDVRRIRKVLGDLDQLLERADLLPAFERLAAAAHRSG